MFDSRWGDDPRDRDDNSRDLSRGSRGGSDPRDGSASTLARCSWSTSTCLAASNENTFTTTARPSDLRGSETRTLTTVGAFRAVPGSDLRDDFDQPLDPRHGELWHLRLMVLDAIVEDPDLVWLGTVEEKVDTSHNVASDRG